MQQKPDSPVDSPETHGLARRRLLMSLAAAGGAVASATVLPRRWTRPVVDSMIVPLHAQATDLINTTTSIERSSPSPGDHQA